VSDLLGISSLLYYFLMGFGQDPKFVQMGPMGPARPGLGPGPKGPMGLAGPRPKGLMGPMGLAGPIGPGIPVKKKMRVS